MSNILSKEDLLTLAGTNASKALANDAQRQAALDYIAANELPKPKDEAWLKTNLKPLLQHNYKAAQPASITKEELAEFKIDGLVANVLVFVNGFYQPELSEIISDKNQLFVKSLSTAKEHHTNLLARYYDRPEDSVFTALNTAFVTDGTFIIVPKGKVVEHPVHIIHIAKADAPILVQNRNVFVAEENTQVKIVESFHSLGDAPLFTNAATSFRLEKASVVNYNLFEHQAEASYLLNSMKVWQKRDSNFSANTITLRGALVRNTITLEHEDEHVETDLNGLYLVDSGQHVDNHIFVNHAKAQCNSNQFYRGILDGTGSAVFTGKVYVAKDSQQTNANQSNKNILLTDTAKVSSKPQLEIYADDVACAHGSSTGQLDKDAMFYMVQRGLSPKEAKTFLLFAFVADVVNKISIEPLREYVDAFVSKRLRGE
jgi:Fe-S cluster assembly protein SufD